VFIHVQGTALLPDLAMPEHRRLRNDVVATLPDGKLLEMVPVFRGMFDTRITRTLAGEQATPHDDIAVTPRIDLHRHAMQYARVIGIVGVQERQDFTPGLGEATIDGVGLA